MKIKAILFTSLILSLVFSELYSQRTDDVLAKAEGILIYKDEFKKRFDLSPHSGIGNNFDTLKIKDEFLKTIIAEKLLAREAEKSGIDKNPEFIRPFNFVRNYYLRDALYKVEVKDKIVIADKDFEEGRRRIGKTYATKFIFSSDSDEINKIYGALSAGASFDSILALRPENLEQENPEPIEFGKMDERIEKELFGLKANQFTVPVEMSEGWYICKAYSVTNKSFIDNSDIEKIKRVLIDRAETKRFREFYSDFFKNISVNVDRSLFDIINNTLYNYIKNNLSSIQKQKEKYIAGEDHLIPIASYLQKVHLESVFVKFTVNAVTLADFIADIGLEGFDFVETDSLYLRNRLNNFVSSFIKNELLAREALKRGYDKLPDVAEELKLWRENYLANLYTKQIFKEQVVSDAEAEEFYSNEYNTIITPSEIKIAEILTDDLDIIKLVFDELNKGADFIELARKYTMRNASVAPGGVYDFQPTNKEGKIWEAAASLKVGEVFGPIKLPEGYSLIKLIDKKETDKMPFDNFAEAKEDVKNVLRTKKMYDKLGEIASKLAIDSNLEINQKLLSSIRVNNINMLVYKRFGFGGQLIAFPFTPAFSDWYLKYEKIKQSLSF